MNLAQVKYDCLHFRGHIPCKPNKEFGYTCKDCSLYRKKEKKILLIKLGAIGDVIRTTPLIEALRSKHKNAHISWITHTPSILPKDLVEQIYVWDATSLFIVQNEIYDIAINLDKDQEACILLSQIKSAEKYGFTWAANHIAAATSQAEQKLLTGFFDALSIANTKNYLEEIFEICGLNFKQEAYQINLNPKAVQAWKEKLQLHAPHKKRIGLNTGCGERWHTRLWPDEYWITLIQELQAHGYYPILLGGAAEDEKNKSFAQATGAYYPGHFNLENFIALSANMDSIVTQVSMMMHIAIALKVKMVLMNNIFNKHEFELYHNGEIVEPHSGCDCYFGNTCKRKKSCMYDLSPATIFSKIQSVLA